MALSWGTHTGMGDSNTGSDDPEQCDRKRTGSVSVTPVCAGVSGVDGESSKEEVMFRLRPGGRVGDGQKRAEGASRAMGAESLQHTPSHTQSQPEGGGWQEAEVRRATPAHTNTASGQMQDQGFSLCSKQGRTWSDLLFSRITVPAAMASGDGQCSFTSRGSSPGMFEEKES